MPVPAPGADDFTVLALSTYDGSGQTVHPDIAVGPDGPVLVITPYPFGNSSYENPSLYVTDGSRWFAPPGVSNPLVRPRSGYLSDPDLVYVPDTQEWWLYYREADEQNIIWVVRSNDRLRWSAPVEVARAPNHEIVSPTVVRRSANDWLMWAVNGGSGCTAPRGTVELRRSTDGLHWSSPMAVVLPPSNGLTPWHIDVQWMDALGEYWALYNAKEAGSCTTPALYLATSRDGMTWATYPTPVLSKGADPAIADIVYRSTFWYDAESDVVTFWYSGARYDGNNYAWATVTQQRPRAALLADVSRAIPDRALASMYARRVGVPPLMIGP